MIRFFQALDAYGEQRVLLLAVHQMDIIPNHDEAIEINGKEFIVLRVKHFLDTNTMAMDTELTVCPPELLMDIDLQVEYLDDEDYDYDR